MRKRLFISYVGCLLVFLLLGQSGAAGGNSSSDELIRIGILSGQAMVTLTSNTNWRIVNPTDGSVQYDGSGRETVTCQADDSRIVIGAEQAGSRLQFVPAAGADGITAVLVNGSPYRGSIELRAVGSTLTVINILPLEEYLYGVLPREIPAAWPTEVLRAQAIVSRTYALASKGRYAAEGYDLSASVSSQVYGGLSGEHPNTNAAVNATKGMVLTYRGGVITAVFHASSGGYTENNEVVWQGSPTPYLRAVPDEFDSAQPENPHRSWQANLTLADIAAKLAAAGNDVGDVYSVAAAGEKTVSGRQRGIVVRGSKGSREMDATDFQTMLGLKSTRFDIITHSEGTGFYTRACDPNESLAVCGAYGITTAKRAKGISVVGAAGIVSEINTPSVVGITKLTGEVELIGQGWGHGVGMSQWGARGMALAGYNCGEILQHYYQGVDITPR